MKNPTLWSQKPMESWEKWFQKFTYTVVEWDRMPWQYSIPAITERIPESSIFINDVCKAAYTSNDLENRIIL